MGKRTFKISCDGSMKFIAPIINIVFYILCGIIILFLIQLFCYTSFKIPSDSMEPILMNGDRILVDKMVKGARLFNVFASLKNKEVVIYRIPGWGNFERNDVVVFNFPYPAQWDSIGLNLMSYYVKRCVALPGDTFEIRKARYRVRGCETSLGNEESQDALMRMVANNKEKECGIVMSGYPYNGLVNWNIVCFGPLYLPAKGDEIEMTPKHVALYRNAIEWEQKKKLSLRGDTVLLNDSVIHAYRFKENYYFVAGDKVMYSQDSRYWGLLPEPFIVGKAVRIWKSVNRNTGKNRWGRIFKRIE